MQSAAAGMRVGMYQQLVAGAVSGRVDSQPRKGTGSGIMVGKGGHSDTPYHFRYGVNQGLP